ncbi:hypothetical protein PV328_000301 [Microctonus aethiopoides]|uniref:AAA-ATPase-like domain-containing protein n=1 Tax=Microctonus aethiopoides TaxID=144406 RepID=A0AA39FUU1_9HYME|nr:hypothetical protein PV328_000301 [Microctonus aethiopoides]
MESPIAKRPKMSVNKINQSTQASSDTKKFKLPDGAGSIYENYYKKPYYIDKTLLIKELFKKTHVLITTPARFSKSLNMDMVKTFVEIEVDEDGKPIELDVDEDKRCLKEIQPRSKNFNLYQGKNIFKDKEFVFQYFGKYPTIYVNVYGVQADDFEGICDDLRSAIHEAFRKHAYLRDSSLWNRPGYNKKTFMRYWDSEKSESLSEEELQSGLKFLSKCLHGYYGKPVYVFIEELDRPLTRMIYGSRMTFKDKEKTIALLQMIFTKLLEGNECTTLEDGRLIHIYSPWAILQSLRSVMNGLDYISIRIKDGISHVKITPKILKLMSGECVTIKYVKNYGIKDIEILSKLSYESEYESKYESEISDYGVDLFIQFLYEDGFLYPTHLGDSYLTLTIPNKAAHRLIDGDVRLANWSRKLEDPFLRSIHKFAESLKNVAESCKEDRVRTLADSIHVLFRVYFGKTGTYQNDLAINSILIANMFKDLWHVTSRWFTLIGTRCDALLVIEDHKVAFIFDCKSINKKSNYAHRQIIDKRYYTVIEEASLEEIISKRRLNWSIKNKIYLGIHSDKDCKVSITYSLNNMDPNIVVSKRASN